MADLPALQARTLALSGVDKVYLRGSVEIGALRGIDLEVGRGEFVAVMGPSGSGKSTLLGILGLLDRPTCGRCLVGGVDTALLDDRALSRLRSRTVGFVFQSFHLIPQLTVAENVETPLLYAGVPEGEWRARALSCLARVGLLERAEHRPSQLSGGEAQRAAIARALVNSPPVILADEPTGNLDTGTGREVADLLAGLHAEGRTVVLVTHDEMLARRAERVVRLRDGRLDGAGDGPGARP